MSKYASLKEFLSSNFMGVISQGILDFIKNHSDGVSEPELTDITLHSLAWESFDYGILTMAIGIHAESKNAISSHAVSHYYRMTVHGDVLKRLSDLCVDGVEEITEELLPEETVLSLFGLPNITSEQLEDRAEELHAKLCSGIKITNENKYRFPVIGIKEKYQMKLWPADLPDHCFGRLYLKNSTATIYDHLHMEQPYANHPISRGTILLNRKYYTNELIPDDIITVTHEFVHWKLHQVYFIILHILEDEFDVMNCTSEPMILSNDMSMKEKAYFYAEWQANELAVRTAMPEHLVNEAIAEYENNHSNLLHDGTFYENMLCSLAWGNFNVPLVIMKRRLRQLGYDYADGIWIIVNGGYVQPVSFAHSTLKENETFVIDRKHYNKMLHEDSDFAELINSMKYIYAECAVCIFDAKYIKLDESSQFVLSDYARKHMNECCLRFEYVHKSAVTVGDALDKNIYFCRLYTAEEYGRSDDDGHYVLSEAAKNDMAAFFEEHYQILDDMKEKNIVSLHDALLYHKKRKKLTYAQIAERSGLTKEVIDSYFAKPGTSKYRNISLERLMILCNALQLEKNIALDLLKRARLTLNEDERQDRYYHYLLSITNASLEAWNQILIEADLSPLS